MGIAHGIASAALCHLDRPDDLDVLQGGGNTCATDAIGDEIVVQANQAAILFAAVFHMFDLDAGENFALGVVEHRNASD
jgi:hypothetical protein